MPSVSIENIKREVRVALDRNNVSTQLSSIGDVDTLTVEEIIESKIEQAVREVLMTSAHHLLGEGSPIFADGDIQISWDSQEGYGSGSIILPDDFLRLVVFRMTDWSMPVFNAITIDNPLYSVQKSRFSGVRGNPQKPICAVVNSASGLKLEFYSCSAGTGTTVSDARYIPLPKIKDGSIDIPSKLLTACVYKIAYLVAITLADSDRAQVLDALYKTNIE